MQPIAVAYCVVIMIGRAAAECVDKHGKRGVEKYMLFARESPALTGRLSHLPSSWSCERVAQINGIDKLRNARRRRPITVDRGGEIAE